MPKIIAVICIFLFALSSTVAQSVQTEPAPPPPADESVTELESEKSVEKPLQEGTGKPKVEPAAKSRGFDPCLVNSKLPACAKTEKKADKKTQ